MTSGYKGDKTAYIVVFLMAGKKRSDPGGVFLQLDNELLRRSETHDFSYLFQELHFNVPAVEIAAEAQQMYFHCPSLQEASGEIRFGAYITGSCESPL